MEKTYTIVYQGDIGQGLREKNINNYMVLNDKLVVVYTNEDFDPTILDDIEQVSIWKKASPMSSLIKIGDGVVNGETVTNASGTSYIENNPYIAVDDASFSTSIEAISAGFIVLKSPPPRIPSITYKGSLPALIELPPRMRIVVLAPGEPFADVICIPLTRTCKA